MTEKTRRDQLLEELRRYTGLKLEITEDGQRSEDEVLSVLSMFIKPYLKRGNEVSFFRALLRNELSEEEELSGKTQYHLGDDTFYVLYLLFFPQGYDETASEIVHSLSDTKDVLIDWDDTHMILIRLLNGGISPSRLKEAASELADTLSADAMIPVYISYDDCKTGLSEISEALDNALLTERIGRYFSNSDRVYCYGESGLGKLVSKLNEEDAAEYIREHLGGFRFDSLDEEMSETIRVFFDTGLSIAETSRRLFVHRNTLVYRLDKFRNLSGLDLRNFDDAVTARLAMFMEVVIEKGTD